MSLDDSDVLFCGCRSGWLRQADVGRRYATKLTHSIITGHMTFTGSPQICPEKPVYVCSAQETVSLFVSAAPMERTRMKALPIPPRPSTQSLMMTLRMRK